MLMAMAMLMQRPGAAHSWGGGKEGGAMNALRQKEGWQEMGTADPQSRTSQPHLKMSYTLRPDSHRRKGSPLLPSKPHFLRSIQIQKFHPDSLSVHERLPEQLLLVVAAAARLAPHLHATQRGLSVKLRGLGRAARGESAVVKGSRRLRAQGKERAELRKGRPRCVMKEGRGVYSQQEPS